MNKIKLDVTKEKTRKLGIKEEALFTYQEIRH
jgi:hypothetical protein